MDLAAGTAEFPRLDVFEKWIVLGTCHAEAVKEVVIVEPGLPIVPRDLSEVGKVVLRDLFALVDVPVGGDNDLGAREVFHHVGVARMIE